MKRSPARPTKACNILLGISSAVHVTSGIAVIVFQIILIHASSPLHDIGAGLWAGPCFFIQGVLGFICLCDTLMCSVISFLVSSILGALLTVALTAIAGSDLGFIYRCPNDDYRSSLYFPPYCNSYFAPRIREAAWGIVIASSLQLVASVCSIYVCMRIIYSSDSDHPTPALSNPYLYDEIHPSSPSQTRFRGSLQSAQDKVYTFRNKSTYSLNSTLPVRRSKSVDRFTDEESDSFADQEPMTMASTHSVNVVPSGMRYSSNKNKKPTRVPHANSVYSVLYPPGRPVRIVPRPPSTRSLNLNSDLPGYMKHTAV